MRLLSFLSLCIIFTGSVLSTAAVKPPKAASVPTAWREWRGDGTGICRDKNISVYWDRTHNILWKTVLQGEGSSSPIAASGKVFLTSSSDSGKVRHILCYDARTGKQLWDKTFSVASVGQTHPYSGYAAPTPVTDGKAVYAFFESPGLIAVDMSGNTLWTCPLGPFNNIYNMAGSPILYKNSIIINCDHMGQSFIASVDCKTGNILWKTPRPPALNYTTPIIVKANGKNLVLVNGTTIRAYDADNGKLIWECKGMTDAVTPSPVQMDGLVLCTSGRNGPTLIIDPKGSGDVSETYVVAQNPTGGPYVPSPLAYNVFLVPNDNGTFRIFDRSGTLLLEHRFPGQFTSSPTVVNGKIYWTSEKGDTYVFETGTPQKPGFKLISINSLGARVMASPAFLNGSIFIRTAGQLYCINGKTVLPLKAKPEPPAPSFADLKEQFLSHPGIDEGNPNVAIRVEIADKMGLVRDPEAPAFLYKAIMEDHWDVSETAMRSLGKQGDTALPVLMQLTTDYRQWVKTLACQSLGSIGNPKAVDTLVKATTDPDRVVRMSALSALASISTRNPDTLKDVSNTIVNLLSDKDGVVRASAARESANLVGIDDEMSGKIISGLRNMLNDPSPIAAANARESLSKLNTKRETK